MPTYVTKEKEDEKEIQKQICAIVPKGLKEYFYRKHEESWLDFTLRIRKIVDAYNMALTSKPMPSTLFQPEWDNKAMTHEQRDFNYDLNHATIEGWNQAAKKAKRLVGRKICEGMGDGYGVYVVVKENRTTLRLQVCLGIGDDWTPWGHEYSIDKAMALRCYLQDSPFAGRF